MIRSTYVSLLDFFERSYVPRRLVGASDSRRHQYLVQFRHFARFLGHDPTLDDLDDEVVGAFMMWLRSGSDRDGVKRAAATVNKARAHICAVWNLAAKKRLVDEFPDVPTMPEPEPTPIAWREDEIRKLLAAAAAMPRFVGEIPARHWWNAVIRSMLDTGERTWALLEVKPEWVDLERRRIAVHAHVRKGGAKAMTYPIKVTTAAAIANIFDARREHVFPWPLDRSSFYNHFTRLLKLAGLPSGRKRKGQGLRITFASHVTLHGGDATKLMRHSDRRVTERSYIDKSLTAEAGGADILPEW